MVKEYSELIKHLYYLPIGGGFFELDYSKLEFDKNGNIIRKFKYVPFGVSLPVIYQLTKNKGKKNSITRPFVYTDRSTNTISKIRKYELEHTELQKKLDDLPSIKKVNDWCLENENGKDWEHNKIRPSITFITPGIINDIRNVFEEYGKFKDVYLQTEPCDFFSYTPEDIEHNFIKIC